MKVNKRRILDMEIKDSFINVNGRRVHLLSAGESGSPVVLFHGAGADSGRISWGHVIGPLAESGHRVFAPDIIGYGDSDRPDIPYTVDTLVDFAAAVLDALGLEKASLMGLSLGGSIVLGLALKAPQRVDKLVLVDSYGIQRKVAMHQLSWLMVKIPGIMEGTWALMRSGRSMAKWSMVNVVHDPKVIPDALMDELVLEMHKPHAGRAFTYTQRHDMFWNGLRTVYIDRLGELKMPVLLIHGRYDAGVPLACAEEAKRRIAGAKLHIIEDAGHWPQREKPEEFIRTAADFLRD